MCHNQVAIIGYDPVDGFPDRYQCKIMRQEGRHCGPEAKLFVEKVVTDNLWTQIFGQRQT